MPNDKRSRDELLELVRKLGLTSDPSDLISLRSELKARISELHPDHQTVDPTTRLQLLEKALRKTGKSSTALQKIEPNSQIARVNAPGMLSPMETVETRLDSIRTSEKNARSRAFLIPRISLGGLTVILTWTFLFPKTFMDHPFIGQMLKGPYAVIIWMVAIALIAIAWLSVWWLDQHKRSRVDQMLSLQYQKRALDQAATVGAGQFSASDFQDKLWSRYELSPRWLRCLARIVLWKGLYIYTSPLYDPLLAEKTAELALERLVQKGWIVRIERPEDKTGTDDWYKIV